MRRLHRLLPGRHHDPVAQRGEVGLRSPHDRRADCWLLACRQRNASYLAFDSHHPSSATSLIQAAAVRNGSHWCPNFDAAAFRAVLVQGEGLRREWPMADDDMFEESESDIYDECVAAIESRSLVKREGWTIRAIRNAVHGGELHEPFNAASVNAALGITYAGTFLPKHRRGNPGGETEHFVRVSRRPASYRLLGT